MSHRINTRNEWRPRLTHTPRIVRSALAFILLAVATMGLGHALQIKPSDSASGIDLQVLSTSIASDASGNTYYVDTAHSLVYKVSSVGVQTQIQCCISMAVGLNQPRGIALDNQGDLYIADTGNNRVIEINSSSQASVVNIGLYRLLHPSGVALDANGDLYIADSGNNRVLEVAATGGQAYVVDTTSYQLSTPSSVSLDKNHTLYIADTGNNRIVTVPASGSPSTLFSNQLHGPLSMTIDGDGNAYIAQTTTDAPSSQGGSNGNGEMPAVVSSFSATNLNVDAGSGSQGTIATANVTLTPMGGFNGTVYLSVVGLPPNVIMQLTHPIVSFNGNAPVAELLQVGQSAETQQSRMTISRNRSRAFRDRRIGMALAGLLPFSLLMLIGFRASSRKMAGACKFLGILTLLLLLPAMTATTSGCADGYPAGLFGSATYTATLIAKPANGKPYSLGSFGITVAN
jgi:sugar lactone lactonase YvrE